MEENISQKEKGKSRRGNDRTGIPRTVERLFGHQAPQARRNNNQSIQLCQPGVIRASSVVPASPYIMHPLLWQKIVCNEIGLGSTSICSALLHDVVEDTDYTVEDIENIFGPKIAQIVDGLTKISGGIFGDRASAQAERTSRSCCSLCPTISGLSSSR